MNSDSERMNGQLPEKNSGECAEKACENADDRDFGSEFVSDEILCGETEDDCRNGGKIVIAAQKNGGRLDALGGAKAAPLRCGNGQRSFRKSKVCRAHG